MGVMTQFDFLNEELLESSEELAFPSWADEDRRSSFGDSLDVRSIDKAALHDMGSFSGSETDLTPRESDDDDEEVRDRVRSVLSVRQWLSASVSVSPSIYVCLALVVHLSILLCLSIRLTLPVRRCPSVSVRQCLRLRLSVGLLRRSTALPVIDSDLSDGNSALVMLIILTTVLVVVIVLIGPWLRNTASGNLLIVSLSLSGLCSGWPTPQTGAYRERWRRQQCVQRSSWRTRMWWKSRCTPAKMTRPRKRRKKAKVRPSPGLFYSV